MIGAAAVVAAAIEDVSQAVQPGNNVQGIFAPAAKLLREATTNNLAKATIRPLMAAILLVLALQVGGGRSDMSSSTMLTFLCPFRLVHLSLATKAHSSILCELMIVFFALLFIRKGHASDFTSRSYSLKSASIKPGTWKLPL